MVNIQSDSFSGRRLFYVSPYTSRCHLSQKALLSCKREGNVPEQEKFSAGGGSRCPAQRSSARWQGYVRDCPLLYRVWWRHWRPCLRGLPVRWKRHIFRNMRHPPLTKACFDTGTIYFGNNGSSSSYLGRFRLGSAHST